VLLLVFEAVLGLALARGWLTALPFDFHIESAPRVVSGPVLLLASLTPLLLTAAIDRRGARRSAT